MAKAVEESYQTIRKAILRGDYPSGMHLKEADLAATLGVSRTPVREALRRLDAEGLVAVTPNSGTRVATWNQSTVREIFELRAIVESYCAGLAANKINDEQVAELHAIVDAMEGLLDCDTKDGVDQLAALNNQFHAIVLEAADNRHLSAFLPGLIDITVVLKTYTRYSRDELLRSCRQHRDLIEALENRDERWSSAVMSLHLLTARSKYLSRTADEAKDANGGSS
ncbi:MAG: GntR family transcriptional regulator [Flavobacteriaceae bacterium]